ncbi:biotin carboxylase [Oceanobacillus arenosus]|uniref:biotin carboxylase n=1 Tax=Oceanobacillus arenosus TaxID=1229153 RepID=A0A3D8PTZ2_9BACI|nr:acetyl-CoA carboxylase biotin carboxylase subunit [Oceanobacillus arenosus]RDW19586.1 biotin carboxylase [Oceanobacillus arenosus]
MIKKVLVANRAEIAVRIIRTCKKLGIKTVAIYSEADEKAPHVKSADEAYLIGPSRVSESYVKVEKILEIAKLSGVDAIHPGYGFLSENAAFADRCSHEGMIFIGPTSKVIEQMGDKIKARKLMTEAGVPVIPGENTAISSLAEAMEIAEELGFPVMLKAAAGGGGIGMQVVRSAEELQPAFESNSKRALTFFGDGSMFIEKKIDNARHIEIQLLADKHGNVIHLFERDCSVQRRNQKVIEEAPSTFITESTRNAMGEAAIMAAKAIGYTNAGTIEFLVDESESFYFLEMNTRIQVEHPVTEEITGIDIVEQQIRIANGEKLDYKQEDFTINGHAIEARIYAEDPNTFYPSPGHITTLVLPKGEHIRHELAIKNNYDVTPFYDPMIAKLIVTAVSRGDAITLLKGALEEYKIEGIKTNIPLLLNIVNHDAFIKGATTTDFIEKHVKMKTKDK